MLARPHSYGLPWRVLVCHQHPFAAHLHFLIPTEGGEGAARPV